MPQNNGRGGMSSSTLKILQRDFLLDIESRLKGFTEGLVRIKEVGFEKDPANEMYRIIHNIKGTAATLKMGEISEAAYAMEKLLLDLVRGEKAFSILLGEDLSLLLAGLKDMAHAYLKGVLPSEIKKEKNRMLKGLHANTLQIMIVHEEPKVRHFIKENVLNTLGAQRVEIWESPDSLDVLPLVIGYPIDVMLLQEHFSVLDGRDLLKMLRVLEDKKDLRSFFIHAEGEPEATKYVFSATEDSTPKAISLKELLTAFTQGGIHG
ncbi:MAG: hypothetical protein CVV50_03775 [Spirochaetae bacterium HGW-Spirochaetae-6]|nr:MAG: hypothetical protein CVV50_03775 [Spirochaetae bacterium HGW-Spirochaetae-6]